MTPFRPLLNRLRARARLPAPDFLSRAAETWEVSPAETLRFPPALVAPGHLDRITGTMFGDHAETIHALTADHDGRIEPTRGYRFRDVDLVDGVLYHGPAEHHLRARRGRGLLARRPDLSISGALYECWSGNRWFGNWLMEDCTAWPLAADLNPVTTAPPGKGHVPRYEAILDMTPARIGDAHFNELVMFDDRPNTASRRARAAAMRGLLARGRDSTPHPGVFLMRGQTGDARILENEAELADRLATLRGFRVMFPERHSVDELLDACAGARVIAGVEGSQLVHGLAVMPPGGMLLTIQPPDRTTAAMKVMTDRLDQRFGLVVATGDMHRFRAEGDDLLRVLDMPD